MYKATSDPNGFAVCAPRYAAPSSAFGSSGVLILTVPTFDASGHDGAWSFCKPIWVSEQACNPSAAEGFNTTPSGSVTDRPLTVDSAKPPATRVVSWDTCSSTVSPVGVLPAVPSGVTLIDGLNGRRLQPSIACIGSPGNVWKLPGCAHESASTLVCNAPVHDVGITSNGGG